MEYSKMVRYATNITGDHRVAKDVVHDYWLYMKQKDIDVLTAVLPKNYIYTGLKRAHQNRSYRDTWYTYNYVTHYQVKAELPEEIPIPGFFEELTFDQQAERLEMASKVSKMKRIVTDKASRLTHKNDRIRQESIEKYSLIMDKLVKGHCIEKIATDLGVSHQNILYYVKSIRSWLR